MIRLLTETGTSPARSGPFCWQELRGINLSPPSKDFTDADLQRKIFKVHKDLLERCTSCFQEHMLFDTVAAEKKLIFLNEDNPDAFELIRTWTYTGLFLLNTVTQSFNSSHRLLQQERF